VFRRTEVLKYVALYIKIIIPMMMREEILLTLSESSSYPEAGERESSGE